MILLLSSESSAGKSPVKSEIYVNSGKTGTLNPDESRQSPF